jgi:16S rRNA (uracil1498-N3)-methyltransferase
VKLDALLKGWEAGRALFFADETGGAPAAATFAAQPARRRAADRPRGRL